MSPERARYGVVVEGDLGGMRQMLLHPLPQEYLNYEGELEETNPWAAIVLSGSNMLTRLTLSSKNAWVEVES